jgi:hypothetical protein
MSSYLAEANRVEQTGSKRRALKKQKAGEGTVILEEYLIKSRKWLHLFGEFDKTGRANAKGAPVSAAQSLLRGPRNSFSFALGKSFLSPHC